MELTITFLTIILMFTYFKLKINKLNKILKKEHSDILVILHYLWEDSLPKKEGLLQTDVSGENLDSEIKLYFKKMCMKYGLRRFEDKDKLILYIEQLNK